MIYFLETTTKYSDNWSIAFYYLLALAILISIFWTYIQVFVKSLKKKKDLKENVIYQNSEDIIENADKVPLKRKKLDFEKEFAYKTNRNQREKYYEKVYNENKETENKDD